MNCRLCSGEVVWCAMMLAIELHKSTGWVSVSVMRLLKFGVEEVMEEKGRKWWHPASPPGSHRGRCV